MTKNHTIFYGAAIQGASERSKRAQINGRIIEIIKSCGFSVITEHTKGLDFDDTANELEKSIGPLPPPGKERTVFIRNKMIEFVESDIAAAVFDVSTPSLGTGVEIAHAYLRPRMGLAAIPVIALYQKGFWPNHLSAMIRGISDSEVPFFSLVEYDTPEDISSRLMPVLNRLNRTDPDNPKDCGRVIARKCRCCGHHEIGIETDTGGFLCLKPGMEIKII